MTTRQEWQAQSVKDWRRVHLNYFADCIEHVLPYAPNAPVEYQKMVTLIRQVGDGVLDRQAAKSAFREFEKRLKKWKFKYSPEGEIGKVIATALNWARHAKSFHYYGWFVQPCTDVMLIHENESRDVKDWLHSKMQDAENDWQNARYHEVGKELDRYNGGWRAHKKDAAVAATAA